MKKSELKSLIREEAMRLLKEGEQSIFTVKGKNYKKQSNGKYLEVSDDGLTKKDHEKQSKNLLPKDFEGKIISSVFFISSKKEWVIDTQGQDYFVINKNLEFSGIKP